jgi:hypothetical protein
MLVASKPRSANSRTAVFKIRSRVISDGRFILAPNPDFKRMFEIHHFYVEGKAKRTAKRTFCTQGKRGAQKSPRAREERALGFMPWGGREKAATNL